MKGPPLGFVSGLWCCWTPASLCNQPVTPQMSKCLSSEYKHISTNTIVCTLRHGDKHAGKQTHRRPDVFYQSPSHRDYCETKRGGSRREWGLVHQSQRGRYRSYSSWLRGNAKSDTSVSAGVQDIGLCVCTCEIFHPSIHPSSQPASQPASHPSVHLLYLMKDSVSDLCVCLCLCLCVCACARVIPLMIPHGEQARGRCDTPDVILYFFFLLCIPPLPPDRRTNMHIKHVHAHKQIYKPSEHAPEIALAPSEIR